MKVYIVVEKDEKRGRLTKVIRCLRSIDDIPKIYLASETDIDHNPRVEDNDVDKLVRKHFSIEDLLNGH